MACETFIAKRFNAEHETIIEREIGQFIDMDRWNERKAQEDHNHGILASIKDQWPKVEELFGGDEEEI